MKRDKIIYWVSTVLLCLLFFASAMMYLFIYERAHGFFVSLGFPTWLIYPLAALKILGVIAVISRFSGYLKELAYAGFFYDAILALAGHAMVRDGEYAPAILAITLTIVSWVFERRVFGSYRQVPVVTRHQTAVESLGSQSPTFTNG